MLTEKELSRSVSLRFKITIAELIGIIDSYRTRTLCEDIDKVEKFGGVQIFEDLLNVDFSNGLTGTDFVKRKAYFGKNKRKQAKEKTFCDFVKDAISDKILIILMIMGAISLALGLALEPEHRSYSWIEGFAIVFAVFLVVSVTSVNDYQKSRKFKQLQESYSNRQNVTILRSGAYLNLHPSKILVGDILEISDGNIIPVDGILIDSSNVEIDEAAMTGENDKVLKVSYKDAIKLRNEHLESGDKVHEGNSHHTIPSPICISGTTLAEGRGRLLVLCIGENSVEGRVSDLSSQQQPETPLQLKLEKVADFITKIGLVCAGVAVFVLFLRFVIENSTKGWKDTYLNDWVRFLIIGLTVLVVAIPEGLPLAVTISLAYSVNKMQKENNLVKRFHACETMGGANMICSDKTGTLTTNVMTVEHYWLSSGKIIPDFHKHFAMNPEYFSKLKENICVNTNARIEESREIGSKTEIALLKMLIKFGHDDFIQIREKIKKRPTKVFPFSSSRKRSSIVISLDEEGSKRRVHMMGASEVVFSKCDYILNLDGSTSSLTSETKKMGDKCIREMAEDGLRTICLAYRDIPDKFDFNLMQNGLPLVEEGSLVCLGIVGIKDPVRPEVPAAVEKCKIAGVKVRMVTGDNKITARAIAKECGIICGENSIVMEGQEFRERVGGVICNNCLVDICECARDSAKATPGQKIRTDIVKNLEEFKKFIYDLDVLARSQPEDKYTLVTGLMQLGNVVAVTGDGTNDAPALKKADIGFAMGIAGTELAREAAGIILLDDNFSSIISAILWGRNIYDNIQRFIQFQLTVNVVAVSCAIVGAVTIKQSPLTAVQMLWVNLIMDTFASLALATQPPTPEMLERPPVPKNVSIVTKLMWKHILGQAFIELVIVFALVYAGENFLIEDGDYSEESVKHNGDYVISGRFYYVNGEEDYYDKYKDAEVGPSRHFTYVFNIFVIMQLFNEFNARKIKDELNIFQGLKSSPMFIIIWFITIGFQILMVEVGSWAFSCHFLGLTGIQWLICFGFGSVPMFWRLFLLLIPSKYFKDWGSAQRDPNAGPGLASSIRRSMDLMGRRVHPVV
jgi:Ca2+ transporting ATPase